MNGDAVFAAFLSLIIMLLGAGVVGAVRSWNKLHKCMDDHFKKIDETLTRLDEWKIGHEQHDVERYEGVLDNISNLRDSLQGIIGKLVEKIGG